MEITSVKIRKVEKESSRMKGIASVVVDDSIAIRDIRIIEGDNNLFIAMPSRKTPAGEYKDIVHPVESKETLHAKISLISYKKNNAGGPEDNTPSQTVRTQQRILTA